MSEYPECEKLAEVRKVALERMYGDYGLDEELVEHCMGPMYRRMMWFSGFNADHPYTETGGSQKQWDDKTTIRDHVNGWLEEQEKQVREEYIQRCREVNA